MSHELPPDHKKEKKKGEKQKSDWRDFIQYVAFSMKTSEGTNLEEKERKKAEIIGQVIIGITKTLTNNKGELIRYIAEISRHPDCNLIFRDAAIGWLANEADKAYAKEEISKNHKGIPFE